MLQLNSELRTRQNLSPVLGNVFIQRTPPLEMTPGGSSDGQPHMAQCSDVQAYTRLHNKYCHCLEDAERKSMSHCDLTTHTCPTCFGERLSCILCVHKCVYATVWGGEQKRVRARHRNTGVFWFRQQISTIIRWIVSHAQHLSQTHTNCLFQTHKHSHYMVITVRLMLCSPLYYALSLLSPSFGLVFLSSSCFTLLSVLSASIHPDGVDLGAATDADRGQAQRVFGESDGDRPTCPEKRGGLKMETGHVGNRHTYMFSTAQSQVERHWHELVGFKCTQSLVADALYAFLLQRHTKTEGVEH